MPFNPARHHRRSIRLRNYDYTSAGAYFVTAVTANRDCLFAGAALRSIIERCWLGIPQHAAHASLDAWVVMPNHIHGIVVIDTPRRSPHGRGGSLGVIIGSFKSVSTRRVNRARRLVGVPVWQRNYYERVIRDDNELDRIRAYIAANPARWFCDHENPGRVDDRDEWSVDEERWFALPPSPS